jgi:hypothetical protein
LEAGGSVTNAAGAVIQGSTDNGVFITDGAGTVSNAGTIAVTGTNIDAVQLGAGSANRVIVGAGAVFSGAVDGGNTVGASIVSTLELAAGSGTLAGVGSSFVNFGGITFDTGAAWDISGSTAGLAGGEVISGFTVHDTIDLVGVSETINGFNNGTLSLTGTAPLDLLLPGNFTTGQFQKAPSSDGTAITLACFVDGTRILTEAGEVAVERLEPGARVLSALHRKLLPIAWIGHRWLREASPVRVAAHAFGPGEPHRDLWLSPDHALFVDGVLIPVRYLINGATIVQEHRDEVFYYHVELSTHGVLLAEGLPAESYLDTGNRGAFANGGAAVQMRPDFALGMWRREACAKLMVDGPTVVAVRERLHARTKELGWTTTEAPAPVLLAGGQRILPQPNADGTLSFSLPPGCREVQLRSRATIAAHANLRSTDHRRLGVAVTSLALDGVELPLNDARLGAGWHAPEPGLRWTDGNAGIALAGEHRLEVRYSPLLCYWIERGGRRGQSNRSTEIAGSA